MVSTENFKKVKKLSHFLKLFLLIYLKLFPISFEYKAFIFSIVLSLDFLQLSFYLCADPVSSTSLCSVYRA